MSEYWACSGDNEVRHGLSDEQFEAVIGTKDIFLQACPGSGKTRSVAARVAWLRKSGARIALLSFTRVGADEIAQAVSRDHKVAVDGDHFVGTVQAFFQKYILTPFGHLETGALTGVRIDPDQAESLDPPGLRSADYAFDLEGNILPKSKNAPKSELVVAAVKQAKEHTARQGFVGLEDDIYWSHRVLKNWPELAAALASRFDEVIVDEAQDLSQSQIECLRQLRLAGLTSLVLVGDYDQTIYEWRDAAPELCEAFAADVGLENKLLTENYRSSQRICNLTGKFRSGGSIDTAVGPHAALDVPPLLYLYEEGKESMLPMCLDALVQWANIDVSSKAILVRSGNTAQKISGHTPPTITRDVATLTSAKRAGHDISLMEYKELERLLVRRAFGGRVQPYELDWHVLRSVSMQLLKRLPTLEGDLLHWANTASNLLTEHAQILSPATTIPDGPRTPERWAGLAVESLFSGSNSTTRVTTIHGVKGESIDAVMLVASVPSTAQQRYGFGDAAAWARPLRGDWSGDKEEIRVAYVALTRARKLAVIALPSSTDPLNVQTFITAGFLQMTYEA